MDTEITCPLGSKCEEIRDNKLFRCAWFTEVNGKRPDSTEVVSEKRCAISWLPMLQVEMSQTNRGQTQALESFRNEMVEGNRQTLAIQQAKLMMEQDHG
jgi:hypothetical protein